MLKNGFTLAEVLITLTIIGIVAATTLPSLNSNVNDRALATQARKTYNTLTNAMTAYMANNGVSNLKNIPDSGSGAFDPKDFIENYLKPVSKEAKFTNNTGSLFTGCTSAQYTLSDGSEICVGARTGTDPNMYIPICIDTNGVKGPNKLGRDFFRINILSDGRVDDAKFTTADGALVAKSADLKTGCKGHSNVGYCFGYLIRNDFDYKSLYK